MVEDEYSVEELRERVIQQFGRLPKNKYRAYEEMKKRCGIKDRILEEEVYNSRINNILAALDDLYPVT